MLSMVTLIATSALSDAPDDTIHVKGSHLVEKWVFVALRQCHTNLVELAEEVITCM